MKASDTQASRNGSAPQQQQSLLDRVLPDPAKLPAILRPKDWVPPEERLERPEAVPPPPREAKRAKAKPQDDRYVPPHEVPLARGSFGRRLGVTAVWVLVAVVMLRGIQGIVQGNPKPVVHVNPVVSQATWPNPQADAFAVRFANLYFTIGKGSRGSAKQIAQISPYLTRALSTQLSNGLGTSNTITPVISKTGQQVTYASPSGYTMLDSTHALIDVGVSTTTTHGPSQYLAYTIPVVRDNAGGLAVYALPAIVPAAPRVAAGTTGPNVQPYTNAGAQNVIQRFFTAWTAGDQTQLSYLTVSGTKVYPLPTGLSLVSIDQLQQVIPQGTNANQFSNNPTIDATVTMRDSAGTKTVADYYFMLIRQADGNWYVKAVKAAA